MWGVYSMQTWVDIVCRHIACHPGINVVPWIFQSGSSSEHNQRTSIFSWCMPADAWRALTALSAVVYHFPKSTVSTPAVLCFPVSSIIRCLIVMVWPSSMMTGENHRPSCRVTSAVVTSNGCMCAAICSWVSRTWIAPTVLGTHGSGWSVTGVYKGTCCAWTSCGMQCIVLLHGSGDSDPWSPSSPSLVSYTSFTALVCFSMTTLTLPSVALFLVVPVLDAELVLWMLWWPSGLTLSVVRVGFFAPAGTPCVSESPLLIA